MCYCHSMSTSMRDAALQLVDSCTESFIQNINTNAPFGDVRQTLSAVMAWLLELSFHNMLAVLRLSRSLAKLMIYILKSCYWINAIMVSMLVHPQGLSSCQILAA